MPSPGPTSPNSSRSGRCSPRPTRARPAPRGCSCDDVPGDAPHDVPVRGRGVGQLRPDASPAPDGRGPDLPGDPGDDRPGARRPAGADRLLRQPGGVLRHPLRAHEPDGDDDQRPVGEPGGPGPDRGPALGMAARYGGGYLETVPPAGGPRPAGADVSHAWAALWVPGSGWVDVDPTNQQFVNDRYVTTAWGRDYSDVPPLKGVIFTKGIEHELEVVVDVVPLDDPG